MTIESTDLQNSTNPAITYSECYAQVFLGDCLELYKNIEPKSIDLILTDLPYGTTACKWDTIIPFDKLWEMVNYLLKPNGAFITTASQPFTSDLINSNRDSFKYELIWDKMQGSNMYEATKRPLKSHENILVFYNKQPIYNPQKTKSLPKNMRDRVKNKFKGVSDGIYGECKEYTPIKNENERYPLSVYYHSSQGSELHKTKRKHPTQKPLELFEWLVKSFTNENMTIFDPCMGSGTTGVACKNTNRSFIGIEKDEAYFKIAEQRINARTLFS